MKRKISKIFGVGLALVLVLSLSLVMAAPVAATGPTGLPVFTIAAGGTAEWSTDHPISGSYSAKLGLTISAIDEARVVFNYDGNLTSIAGVSYQSYVEGGEDGQLFPIVVLAVDIDDDPEVDTWVVGSGLTTEGGFVYDKLKDEWREIVFDDDFPVHVAGDRTGLPGDHYLAYGNINSDGDTLGALKAETGWGEFTVVEVKVMIGEFTGLTEIMTAYVDDITINDVPYDLEPIFLDAAYPYFYTSGSTVTVTVCNGGANVDLNRADAVIVDVVSTTDTIGFTGEEDGIVLTETGPNTGVFEGQFPTTLDIPPGAGELVVADEDTITITYTGDWGAGEQTLNSTATVDDSVPTIDDTLMVEGVPVTTPGTIIFNDSPEIVATVTDVGSDINEASIEMTVNGEAVTTIYNDMTDTVTYSTSPELAAGTIVEVTVDVDDNMGNSAEQASWSFTIADEFNVSLDTSEISAAFTTASIIATFEDVDGAGIVEGTADAAELFSVQVTLSGVGIDMDSDVLTGDGVFQYTFNNVTPEEAGDIIATFVGTFGDESEVTKTLTITVTGFVVEETWADVGLGTTDDISMTVTTKAGATVNTGIVTITAPAAGGFEKNVDGVAGDESFNKIIINDPEGKITYKADVTQVGQEDFSVIEGVYKVTGIKFADVGAVDVLVEDAADNDKARFPTAFTVLGNEVYSLSFEPIKLTAGFDLGALDITVTEAGEPATDVESITIDADEFTIGDGLTHLGSGVYELDPALVSEEKTGEDALTVAAKNADDTKWGSASLEVELPSVSYVITDAAEIERTLMLTGQAYTITVTVTDALGEALAGGKIEIGKYTDTAFTALDAGTPDEIKANDLALDAEGKATFEEVKLGAEATLVWKVGKPDASALVLEPAIAVQSLSYDVNPKEAVAGVETTFTVSDNYGDPAADRDIKIVTPAIETDLRTTGPAGTPLAGKFMYNALEVGDYYVSVKLDDLTWQDAITVTVSGVATIDLYEGANPIHYTGATTDLPGALTNIVDLTEVIWQRDASTGGEWWYYLVPLDHGQITQLENGRVYIVVVSQACTWELPQ